MAAKARAAAKAAVGKKAGAAGGGAAKADVATKDKKGGADEAKSVQALPAKEQKTFKEILNLYETKQHRKGLKNCEALLKKFPDHGETLAMQGLFHHSLNDKQLGYDLVKKGVRANLRSHIVWHVYGIMTRADRNYEEALKCYAQAHRIDPDNVHILRDLSLLQVQLRHYQAYLSSRHQYLRANWKTRQQWLALALAYHLASQPSDALDVLVALESAQTDVADLRCFEISEIILFTAHVALTIPGKEEWVLEFLEDRGGKVIDRTSFMVMRAKVLGRLGRAEAAEWAWTALLDLNSESAEYIRGYVELKGHSLPERRKVPAQQLSGEERSAILNILQTLRSRYPKSLLLQRLVLDFTTGDLFREEADAYLRTGIQRGVPSLFNDVKSLCADEAKAEAIQNIVQQFCNTLENGGTIDAESSTGGSDDSEAPSSYLWTLYFLAQLCSLRGAHARAIDIIALALTHTPTLPDALLVKGRLLKRAGAPSLASLAVSEARNLDGQDRFLNGKCAKYLLRVDEVGEAKRLVGLFTRKEAPNPAADLVDMQALWFVLEEGEAYRRLGNVGMALKRFHQVADIFATWVDDQFDFHTYCVRKNTLRVYLDLLETEDHIYSHPQYLRAAKSAIAMYLAMHQRNVAGEPTGHPVVNGVGEPKVNGTPGEESAEKAAESKKAQKKAKQAEAKAKAAAAVEAKKAASTNTANTKDKDSEADQLPPDDDPQGEKLAATAEPLEAALTLWRPLGQMCKESVDTWLLSFEIELAREKPLLALKAYKQARELIAHDDSRLHVPLTRLFQALSDATHEPVKTALQDELSSLTPHKTLSEANAAFLSAHPDSPVHILAVLESVVVLRSGVEEAEKLAFDRLLRGNAVRWQDAEVGLRLLKEAKSGRVEEFRKRASERWVLAETFCTAEEKARRVNATKREYRMGDTAPEQAQGPVEGGEGPESKVEVIDP